MPEPDENFQLNPRLDEDLRRLHQPTPPIEVPTTIDHAIHARAAAHLRRSRMSLARLFLLRAAPFAAVAALIAAAIVLPQLLQHGPTAQPLTSNTPIADDLDHNGRVDVVDAFLRARDNPADARRIAFSVVAVHNDQPAQTQPDIVSGELRPVTVDVFIDPRGKPLAAWQFHFTAETAPGAAAMVVGLESGDPAAFPDAPFYDQDAANKGRSNRLTIAGFSPPAVQTHPAAKIRVATIHILAMGGDAKPRFRLALDTAAGPDGKPIPADITFSEGKSP